MLLLFCSLVKNALAVKHLTIATIGNLPPAMENGIDNQIVVEQVIHFWKQEIEQVLPYKPDLILLPEACDRPMGFISEKQFDYFRERKNQLQDFFASVARSNRCYVIFGTKYEESKGIWRNSSIILDRKGALVGIYNKNFPTIGEMETGVKPGYEAPVFRCDFGTIACAICFDLNFKELLDRYAVQNPDVILFSSMYHGGQMQANWAYTCRSFFIGSIGNRKVPSEIRNPQGEVIKTSTEYFDFAVATINLDTEIAHLDFNWEKLEKLKEKYGTDVTISDPGKLGSVLITSEHKSISAMEMLKEFDIELLDNYLNRSSNIRSSNRERTIH